MKTMDADINRQYDIDPQQIEFNYYGADMFIGDTSTGNGVWLTKPADSNIMYFEQQVYLNVTTMNYPGYVFAETEMDWPSIKMLLQLMDFDGKPYTDHPFVQAFVDSIGDNDLHVNDVEVWVRCCNDTATGDSCWVRLPNLCTGCAGNCGLE